MLESLENRLRLVQSHCLVGLTALIGATLINDGFLGDTMKYRYECDLLV